MPVPASVSTRIVRGTYVDGGGTVRKGVVTFRPDQPLIAMVESWGVVPTPISVSLDSSGSFTTSLMASDDLDLFPSGFMWIVQERFTGGYLRTYRIDVPTDTEPLNLPTASQYDPGDEGLSVVHSVNGLSGIIQLTAAGLGAIPLTQKGAASGIASLGSDSKLDPAQMPASVAGTFQVGSALRVGNAAVGGGVGVLALANAATPPSTNPTGGGIIYVQAGALKYLGSGGTVTTLGAA